MANAEGTGNRPTTSSSTTPRTATTGNVDHEAQMNNGSNVKVFDSEDATSSTPTRTASVIPGSWRGTDEDVPTRTSSGVHPDPAPAARQGMSMMMTIVMLIVIVLIAYFVFQLLF